jgi:hypothetical protein
MRSRVLFALIPLGFAVVLPVLAKDVVTHPEARGEWQVIGRLEAKLEADHDTLEVHGADNFRKLKIRVKDAPLNIRRMEVSFDGGGRQNLGVIGAIPQGGESRVIDLPGNSRSLRKIEFWYDTRGQGRGRADVTVLGRK